MFNLDERLEADTVALAEWPLCTVRLMNDNHYPWLILIPRVAGVTELYQLDESQRQMLDRESTFLARTLMELFNGHKMNVAALGNVVKQLHIHHVVRFEGDVSWPAPIWGKVPVEPYSQASIDELKDKLKPIINKQW